MIFMVKKVLMISSYNTKGRFKGGIEYIIDSILNKKECFASKGFNINHYDTCTIDRNKYSSGKLRFENIMNFLKLRKGVKKAIKTTKYDTVYYHSSLRLALLKDLFVITAIKNTNKAIKVILHIHYAEYEKIMFSRDFLNRLILGLINKYIDRVVFLSNRTRQEFINHGIKREKTICIYNFHLIEFNRLDYIKKFYNTLNKRIVITFMGSIDKRKGIIDCLRALNNCNFDFVFNICGELNDSEIETEFNKMVDNLNGKAKYHGYVSGKHKEDILLNTDVLLLPSYGEGLPIILLEALASGCAIITTNVGAITEIFNDENGIIIRPGDIEGLKNAIISLNENRNLLTEQMRRNLILSKRYYIDAFIDRISSIL